MPSLVEFLNHVLPNDGYKCWVALKKGERPQQGFSSSAEDLAATLTSLDALGYDAYFACATYKEPVSRKGENAKAAKSFWADLDAGEGKPYADADQAAEAVDAFCEKVGMPRATVVYSGGGLHAWWPLSRELTPSEWTYNAKLLKQLMQAHGLHADPTRTADIASILRPPGTRNWKILGNPRPVECLELENGIIQIPTTTEAQPAGTPTAQAPITDMGQGLGEKYTSGLNAAATNIYSTEREPAYASIAANQCAQLRRFRDTRGNISEPIWYAALGVLARCEDGEQLAHEWSSGHPTYSAEETGRKLIQARNKSDATTCERFKALDAGAQSACAGCPFAVTSPIVLGRQKPQAAPVQAPAEVFPALPHGYGMNQRYQLTVEVKYKDGDVEKKYNMPFTKYPIFLAEIRDSEHLTERNQGLLFKQWEPNKGWIEFEITNEQFHGQGVWGKFGYYGNSISDTEHRRAFLKYVDASIMMLKDGGKKMRYEQFGWKNDYTAFYLGNTLYKNDGTNERAAGNAECTKRGEKMSFSKSGSLAAWTHAANKLFVEGCEAQSFGLLASFASVLMPFVTSPGEGGAILSLISPDGGKGKSTALAAIGSVWGEPEALRVAGRDTTNAKFRAMGTNRHLPIIHDELRGRHPELILDFVVGFTEGRDRNRSRIDGTVNPVTHDWQNILISASNKSLVDAINSVQKAGEDPMANRVFEIEVKVPKDVEFSMTGELGNELVYNRGYAGRAFLTYLLQPGVIEWCQKNLKTMADHYTKVTGAQTSHRYVIRLMATVAVAAQICVHLGLMEFSPERIMTWAMEQVVNLVNGTTRFNPVETFTNILCETMISDALVVNCAAGPKVDVVAWQTPRNEVNMRFEVDTKRLYIASGWIRHKLNEKGQPTSLVIKELQNQKILLDTKRRTILTGGIKTLLGGQVTCWEIDMSHPEMAQTYTNEVLPFKLKAV